MAFWGHTRKLYCPEISNNVSSHEVTGKNEEKRTLISSDFLHVKLTSTSHVVFAKVLHMTLIVTGQIRLNDWTVTKSHWKLKVMT